MFDHVMYPPVNGEFIAFWVGAGMMCFGVLLFVCFGVVVGLVARWQSQSNAKVASSATSSSECVAHSVVDL